MRNPQHGIAFLLAQALLASAGCTDEPVDAPDDSGGDDRTHDQVLEDLGFDTDLGPPVDPKGNPLPPDYNPLRKPYGVFRPKAEIYVAGTLWNDGANAPKKEVLFEDKTAAFARMPFVSPIDDTWSQATFKNGIAADLDGDGIDEFFIAYWVQAASELRYVILDPAGGTQKQGTLVTSAPNPTAPRYLPEWAQPALAKGDFAGIGRDQIAIGFAGLYLVDVDGQNVTTTERALTGSGWQHDELSVFVAGGDVDGDKNDELAVSFSVNNGANGRYRLYDGNAIVREDYLTFQDPEPGWGLRTAQLSTVAIGDVDGDHLGEVVFYGKTDGCQGQVFVLDDLVHAPAPDNGWFAFHHAESCWGDIPHPLAVLDFDGDGVKDVFAQARVLKLNVNTKTPGGAPTSTDIHALPPFSSAWGNRARVAVGDVDGDGKEEFIVETDWLVRAIGLDALERPAIKMEAQHGQHTGGGWNSIILTAGNVDKDSAIVKYDGQRELLFTDPNIVAVVSAPPYWKNIGQNVDATTSTFGTRTDMTAEEKTSLGFSVGWSIGSKSNFLFGETESKLTVEHSMDWSSFSSRSVSRALSYTTGGGTDLVVFTAIPFDVYYYTIESSPNPAEVGTKITINVARKPQTLATEPSFYNENTSATALKVDGEILRHELGNPWSYPTQGDMAVIARMPQAAIGTLATSPQSGTTTSSIELSKRTGSGQSIGLSVKFEWSASSLFGPTVGGSVGFQYGYEYTLSTEDTTFYQGTVGAIPANAFSDHIYSFGLMAFPATHGQQKFVQLDYWVE